MPEQLDLEADLFHVLGVLTLNIGLPDGVEDFGLEVNDLVAVLDDARRRLQALVLEEPAVQEGREERVAVQRRQLLRALQTPTDYFTRDYLQFQVLIYLT